MNSLTYTTQDDLLLLGVHHGMGVMGNFVALGLDLVPGSCVDFLLKQLRLPVLQMVLMRNWGRVLDKACACTLKLTLLKKCLKS